MSALSNALTIYMMVALLLFVIKPRSIFTPEGNLRKYGLKEDETLFPFQYVCIAAGLASLFAFTMLESRAKR